jgi:hypothetical protein
VVLWVVAPCGLVHEHQRFGRTYCPHFLELKMEAAYSTETLVLTYQTTRNPPIRLQPVMTQMNTN